MRVNGVLCGFVVAHALAIQLNAQTTSASAALPNQIDKYHLTHRESDTMTGDSISWFDNGVATVAIITGHLQSPVDMAASKSIVPLQRAATRFVTSIRNAQNSGQIDQYQVAYSMRDSVATARGLIPGWNVAIVTKRSNLLTLNLFCAFVVADRILEATSTIPAGAMGTTDIPRFTHDLVREYTEHTLRSGNNAEAVKP